MENLNLKCYAHLGDAVYELFVREKIIFLTSKLSKMHKINTELVRASFQCELVEILEPYINDEEKDLVRRGRNIQTSSARKIDQNLHRIATGFEVLIGYLHLNNPKRLQEIFDIITEHIDSKETVINM